MNRSVLDVEKRARLHAPRTSHEIRIACHELRARGLGDYEIAQACELSVEYVRRLLGTGAKP